ncbi:MAG: TM0106 family RecB-like putative nuclease [Chloroflexi bacterium]|nr:TM0106 family RecB-like putative nuclease [Chloroflexota bacterium]
MDRSNGGVRLSAGDLVADLHCHHLTNLNLEVANGERQRPVRSEPLLEHLRERGLAHERDYLAHLEAGGAPLTRIDADRVDTASVAATLEAMRAGDEFIVQGTLADGVWVGRPDVLRRVNQVSKLGTWSYEVVETKLAQQTKIGTILQLCLYSSLLEAAQGVAPEHMSVVAPWTGFNRQDYRVSDYSAYFRLIRERLQAAVANGGRSETYPEPNPHCDVCPWDEACRDQRRQDDHLSLVAGISRLQREELVLQGISTMAELAAEPLPLRWQPGRGATESYERLREQARVQVADRQSATPVFEPLDPEPSAGLNALPEPSDGDIFLDFEGAPSFGPGGLEYLIGYIATEPSGEREFTALWGFDYAEEKRNFERFVDFVVDRWERYPDLHIYHFAHYEPAAMKRLMGRHATHEADVDRLLRAGLFIDLHRVARRGLRVGAESYSIKELERFFGYERKVSLERADEAMYAITGPLELGAPELIRAEDVRALEEYNRDDVESTVELRDWLEQIRAELERRGSDLTRPARDDGEASERVAEWQDAVDQLFAGLTHDVPIDPAERTAEQQARWLAAGVLDFHRREDKAAWWEFFRLHDCTPEELAEESLALVGLEYKSRVGGTNRAPIHRYRFAPQETKIGGGEQIYAAGEPEQTIGSVEGLDLSERTIEVKKRVAAKTVHPTNAVALNVVNSNVLRQSLLRVGEDVRDHGFADEAGHRVARDILRRTPPRTGGGSLRRSNESTLEAAQRISSSRDFGVLPIQGPPGAGKTYTGARLIAELIAQGARVGITANSHRVIGNLLAGTLDAADERDINLRAVRKVTKGQQIDIDDRHVKLETDNPPVFEALRGGRRLVAGTAWLWAREEAQNAVDVLVVDEAAQMSLANVLAVSHAAPNMVLLGDPQQLEQPLQGSHPEGADVSALAHLIGSHETIEASRGLFLEETWRLHPDICTFTSEMFYEDKLRSRPGLEQQGVIAEGALSGAGLRYLPVTHAGNQSSSDEEAERIATLVGSFVGSAGWCDGHGAQRALAWDDILIIAPYNAQVFNLQARLPEARIGTVDKFQGQEAPIVIYSMTTSTPAEAPRGMEFLYSLNRLNVATSRAQGMCILVGSPALFSPDCSTERQMRLANAFCRYRELALSIEP